MGGKGSGWDRGVPQVPSLEASQGGKLRTGQEAKGEGLRGVIRMVETMGGSNGEASGQQQWEHKMGATPCS